jgi:hypothetical protein
MVDVQTIGVLVTAASVSVAAIYYAFTLRINMKNQELSLKTQELTLKSQQQADETRQAQLFMQVFSRFHDLEFWRIYSTVMSREWKSYDDWSKDGLDSTVSSMRNSLFCYFEGIGVLVSKGLLSSRLVEDILGGTIVMFWVKQGDYIREFRVRAGYPMFCEYLEFLYEEIMKLRPGFSPKVDDVGSFPGNVQG